MTLKIFRPFISNKFWKKVSYIDEISEIYRTIDRDQINFPNYVIQFVFYFLIIFIYLILIYYLKIN